MNRDYDLIVVGAGPAGATTALFARRAGLRVLLLDKRRFPRDKTCGDAVARKSLGIVRELGLLDAVRSQIHEPIRSAVLCSPNRKSLRIDLDGPRRRDARRAVEDSSSPHVVCRRIFFDNILVQAAKNEMDVLENCTVTGLLVEKGRVCGVTCKTEDRVYRRFTADVVVGADGYNSIVTRRLGFYRFDSERWFAATRAYYSGLACPANTVEIHFIDETLPGFLWIFPTGDGVANVGLGMIHKDVKKHGVGLHRIHHDIIDSPRLRDRFKGAELVGRITGSHLPTPDWRRTIHGGGFMLVGDAAGLVDPFSGEGIGNAMSSGKVAARVAAQASAAGDFSAAALAKYPKALWQELHEPELKLHYRLRRVARRGSLINFIIGRAAARPGVLEWISSMTAERDTLTRKRELASPLTYLKLLLRIK
jgi:geranylgeranyl reductase family protein